MSSKKNSLLTPCRQVGLKRKSLSSTSTPPNAGNAFHPHRLTPSSGGIANDDITKSQNTLASPSTVTVNCSLSSPFEQRRTISKRFKRSVITSPPTVIETGSVQQLSDEQSLPAEKEQRISNSTCFQSSSVSSVESSPQETSIDCELSLSEIQLKIDQTRAQISAKQIEIDSLQSQSVNAKQHDLQTLNSLILKWRRSCQNALNELVREHNNRQRPCTMTDLLKSIGIPAKLVKYSETEMDFHEWYVLIFYFSLLSKFNQYQEHRLLKIDEA